MSITKKRGKRANTESPKQAASQRYVVAESVLEDFIDNLRIHDIDAAMARLQAVADLTAQLLKKPESQPGQTDLKLIKRLATESNNKLYRQIINAILEAVKQGPQGINSAHLTARRVVELAAIWSPECLLALDLYRERLRSIRRAA